MVSSNSITVSGIDAAAEMSIEGGEYSIEGGGFTSEDGTVNNGQTVLVRQTSSNKFETKTSTTLTIGGISGVFSVTTLADNIAPTVMVNFPTVVALTDGDTVTVRGTAADQSTGVVANVLVKGISVDSKDGFASWSVEVPLSPGLSSLKVTALDNTGNLNEQSDELSISSNAPLMRPNALAFGSANNRVLVVDGSLRAVIAVDLVSGSRVILSK